MAETYLANTDLYKFKLTFGRTLLLFQQVVLPAEAVYYTSAVIHCEHKERYSKCVFAFDCG